MLHDNTHYSDKLAVEAYDLFTGGDALEGDIEFYIDCAERYGSPLLEIGAGTGRVLLPIATAGHDAVGMDIAPAMLRCAADKLVGSPELAGHAELIEDDMTDFDLGRIFSLIMVTARSFQHLLTPQQQRRALQCIRRHLNEGGRLVLDLFDPRFEFLFGEQRDFPPPMERARSHAAGSIRRSFVSRDIDPLQQIIRETLRFEVLNGVGTVIATEEASWALRWSTRQEIAYLFELCGFKVEEQFSDFQRAAPAYGREQLWIARAI